MIPPGEFSRLRRPLLRWYRTHGRDLPWRTTKDPYAILVSEVMLQQTQVDRVIPKYRAWLKRWPTLEKLAAAPTRDVLQLWSGLGYNRRALYLKRTAETVVRDYGGRLPNHHEILQTFPGLGPYTSRAVSVFAFGHPTAMIDTNIRRIFQRVFFWPRVVKEKTLQSVAEVALPSRAPDTWHHALMDLGARVCVSGRPACEMCPLQPVCRAYPKILRPPRRETESAQASFKDSNRFWRGRIVALLVSMPNLSEVKVWQRLQTFGKLPRRRLRTLLEALARDGLIQSHQKTWRLPV